MAASFDAAITGSTNYDAFARVRRGSSEKNAECELCHPCPRCSPQHNHSSHWGRHAATSFVTRNEAARVPLWVGMARRNGRWRSPPSLLARSARPRHAAAVIQDPTVSPDLLGLVKPSHYREPGPRHQAIKRAIHLARDGWRVERLVEGDAIERAIECAAPCAEHALLFRFVPSAGEAIGREALFLVRKSVLLGHAAPRSSLALVVATPKAEAASNAKPSLPPLGFSMSDLAG
jgi:hypothetical protein